tara:strand:- start:5 stop:349 length:345 start_codon:yes stop_codon:yes gene_type:complete
MKKYVFKILTLNEWKQFKENKIFKGSKLDLISGFIHLSSREQLEETLNIHYLNENNLVIVKLMAYFLKKNLKWEKSRNNQLFPHLFDVLNFRYVSNFFFFNMHKYRNHSYLAIS